MKKRWIIFLLILLFLGCTKKEYDFDLGSNYYIDIEKDDSFLIYDGKEVVSSFILEYAYNDKYILLKRSDSFLDTNNYKYYIINKEDNKIYKELSYTNFLVLKKELKIDDMNWNITIANK